jgi:hypothetical protein
MYLIKVELGAALFSGAHDGWAHHPLSFTEIPSALHSHALVHPALHAQLPVSIVWMTQTFALTLNSDTLHLFFIHS